MKILFIGTLVASFAIACNTNSRSKVEVSTADNTQHAELNKDSLQKEKALQDSILFQKRKDSALLKLTDNILAALKQKNYSSFANFIHPTDGIRFSPYAFVDTVNHIKLSKAAFVSHINKTGQDMIVWGKFDATGDPIRMTLNNYLQRFVYDVDFAKPEKRSVNDFIGAGNSLNNLLTIYKNCDFTESHFSGFDEKYAGMDWKSLRLVFKEKNKRYFLIAIVHDEWTI